MKILGISYGTKNGNNDTMCRVALEECQKMGAEIEFIHAFDWDLQTCTGCVACSRGLVMGKGMICTRKDDFKALYEKMGYRRAGVPRKINDNMDIVFFEKD